jgi:hypothetical protein
VWSSPAPGLALATGHDVLIEMKGSTIEVTIDGVLLFSLLNGLAAPTGRIGFACQASPGATFSSVVVQSLAMWIGDKLILDEDSAANSSWYAANGVLRQSSVSSDTAVISGDPTWTNYRIASLMRWGAAGSAGLIFRYRDAANYYRFAIRADGQRSLVRCRNGLKATLWQNTDAISTGTSHEVAVEAVEHHLTVYLDHVELFSIVDDAHMDGLVGIYSADNPDLTVFWLQVDYAEPQWRSYYSFGKSVRLTAGRRLRLHRGGVLTPSPEPSVRDIALPPSCPSFPADGADLRLLSSDGRTLHMRRFYPDPLFEDVPIRILRKADGTGLVIFPAAPNTALMQNDYRLKLIYRLDNRAHDPDSVVQSQNDSRLDEEVVLDIPWSKAAN